MPFLRCFEDIFEAIPKGQVKNVGSGKSGCHLSSLPTSPLLMLLLLKAWRWYLRAGLTAQIEAVSLTGVGDCCYWGQSSSLQHPQTQFLLKVCSSKAAVLAGDTLPSRAIWYHLASHCPASSTCPQRSQAQD